MVRERVARSFARRLETFVGRDRAVRPDRASSRVPSGVRATVPQPHARCRLAALQQGHPRTGATAISSHHVFGRTRRVVPQTPRRSRTRLRNLRCRRIFRRGDVLPQRRRRSLHPALPDHHPAGALGVRNGLRGAGTDSPMAGEGAEGAGWRFAPVPHRLAVVRDRGGTHRRGRGAGVGAACRQRALSPSCGDGARVFRSVRADATRDPPETRTRLDDARSGDHPPRLRSTRWPPLRNDSSATSA